MFGRRAQEWLGVPPVNTVDTPIDDELEPRDSVIAPSHGSPERPDICVTATPADEAGAIGHASPGEEPIRSTSASDDTSQARRTTESSAYGASIVSWGERGTDAPTLDLELLRPPNPRERHLEMSDLHGKQSASYPGLSQNQTEGPIEAPIPAEQVRTFVKQQHRLQRLRDELLQCRSGLVFEISKEEESERFADESVDNLMAALHLAIGSSDLIAQYGDLVNLEQRARNDVQELRNQRIATKGLREHLSNLEFHVMHCEDEFAATVSAISAALGITDEEVRLVSRDTSVAGESVSDTPSLLAQYYDSKGDVGIYFERLVELEYSYSEDTVQRNFLADQGHISPETDEEFEAKYIQRRNEINVKLGSARAEAARLEEECRQAGYEIPVKSTSEAPDITAFELPQEEDTGGTMGYQDIGRWLERSAFEAAVIDDARPREPPSPKQKPSRRYSSPAEVRRFSSAEVQTSQSFLDTSQLLIRRRNSDTELDPRSVERRRLYLSKMFNFPSVSLTNAILKLTGPPSDID